MGVDPRCEIPSLARPEPASLFKGPRRGCLVDTVQLRLAGLWRSGCAAVARRAVRPSRRGRRLAAPLTDLPTPSVGRPRCRRLAGHSRFSAKFICMGNQKNRLTTRARPARPPRDLGCWSRTDERARRLAGPRARALRRMLQGSCRVARGRPTLDRRTAEKSGRGYMTRAAPCLPCSSTAAAACKHRSTLYC